MMTATAQVLDESPPKKTLCSVISLIFLRFLSIDVGLVCLIACCFMACQKFREVIHQAVALLITLGERVYWTNYLVGRVETPEVNAWIFMTTQNQPLNKFHMAEI